MRPRYKITAKTYHNDRLYEVDEEMDFDGEPAYYMEPVNEAAEEKKKKNPQTEMTFFEELPNTVGEEEDILEEERAKEAGTKRKNRKDGPVDIFN